MHVYVPPTFNTEQNILRLRLGDVFASSDSAGGVGKIVRFKVSLGVWRVSFGLHFVCVAQRHQTNSHLTGSS